MNFTNTVAWIIMQKDSGDQTLASKGSSHTPVKVPRIGEELIEKTFQCKEGMGLTNRIEFQSSLSYDPASELNVRKIFVPYVGDKPTSSPETSVIK